MNNFILITGANDKYFNCCISFINNLKTLSFDFNKFILYDLGIYNNTNINLLNNLQKSLNFKIKKIDYSKYPEHCDLNKYYGENCTYAWKPIIIYNEANENQDNYIIWLDSKCRIKQHTINKICSLIQKQGCWITISNKAGSMEAIRDFHPLCLKNMGLSESDRKKLEMKFAGLIGFNYKHELSKYILDEWYKYSLNKDMICPVGSSRKNHRQDQSVLSIILYKLGNKIQLINDYCDIDKWFYK